MVRITLTWVHTIDKLTWADTRTCMGNYHLPVLTSLITIPGLCCPTQRQFTSSFHRKIYSQRQNKTRGELSGVNCPDACQIQFATILLPSPLTKSSKLKLKRYNCHYKFSVSGPYLAFYFVAVHFVRTARMGKYMPILANGYQKLSII